MGQKNEKKRMEKEKINDFLVKTSTISKESSLEKKDNTEEAQKKEFVKLAYQCPSCHKLISSRKEPCKYCGYSGYIPISEEQTKRIRNVLFVVILVAAVVVYIVTR